MPVIRMPDGAVVDFPDTMSRSEILREIQASEDRVAETARIQREEEIQRKRDEVGIVGAFGRGLGRGITQTGALITDVIPAMVGQTFGADEYRDRQMLEYMEKMQKMEEERPSLVPSITDIDSASDVAKYGLETIGQFVPSVLTSIAGGGIGGLLGQVAAKEGAKKLLQTAGTKAAAKYAQRAQLTGQIGGAFAGSGIQTIPEAYATLEQETGDPKLAASLLVGTFNAALDSIVPAAFLARLGKNGREELSKNMLARTLQKIGTSRGATRGRNVLNSAIKSGVIEGLTEGAQQTTQLSAARLLDENPEFFETGDFTQILDATVRGAIGGKAFGAASGFFQKTSLQQEIEQKDQANNELLTAIEIVQDAGGMKPMLQLTFDEELKNAEQEVANLKNTKGLPKPVRRILNSTTLSAKEKVQRIKNVQKKLKDTLDPETETQQQSRKGLEQLGLEEKLIDQIIEESKIIQLGDETPPLLQLEFDPNAVNSEAELKRVRAQATKDLSLRHPMKKILDSKEISTPNKLKAFKRFIDAEKSRLDRTSKFEQEQQAIDEVAGFETTKKDIQLTDDRPTEYNVVDLKGKSQNVPPFADIEEAKSYIQEQSKPEKLKLQNQLGDDVYNGIATKDLPPTEREMDMKYIQEQQRKIMTGQPLGKRDRQPSTKESQKLILTGASPSKIEGSYYEASERGVDEAETADNPVQDIKSFYDQFSERLDGEKPLTAQEITRALNIIQNTPKYSQYAEDLNDSLTREMVKIIVMRDIRKVPNAARFGKDPFDTTGLEETQDFSDEVAQDPTRRVINQTDKIFIKSREVIENRLEEMAKRGEVGKANSDAIREVLDDPSRTVGEIFTAFEVADIMTKILPDQSGHAIKFLDSLKAIDAQGKEIAGTEGQVQGLRFYNANLVQLAFKTAKMKDGKVVLEFDRDMLKETASHEAFHILQDFYIKYDPQAKKILDQEFGSTDRSEVKINYAMSKTAKWMKRTNKELHEDLLKMDREQGGVTGRELQAYAFSAYNRARLEGRTPVMAGGLSRYFRFVSQFLERLSNSFKGYGFQSAQDVFEAVSSGVASKSFNNRSLAERSSDSTDFEASSRRPEDELLTGPNGVRYATDERRRKRLLPINNNSTTIAKIQLRKNEAKKNIVLPQGERYYSKREQRFQGFGADVIMHPSNINLIKLNTPHQSVVSFIQDVVTNGKIERDADGEVTVRYKNPAYKQIGVVKLEQDKDIPSNIRVMHAYSRDDKKLQEQRNAQLRREAERVKARQAPDEATPEDILEFRRQMQRKAEASARGMQFVDDETTRVVGGIKVERTFKDVVTAPPLNRLEGAVFNNIEIPNPPPFQKRTENLPIASLIATQPTVSPNIVEDDSMNNALPSAVKKGGEYYLTDGHHRLVNQAKNGVQNTNINVLDFDQTEETRITEADQQLLRDLGFEASARGASNLIDQLIVQHNLGDSALKSADRLGGLPVPSLAITKAETPLTNFGAISLLGTRDMAKPSARNPVYSADAYTVRRPPIEKDEDGNERLFLGFTYSGRRRYKPATIENIVKEMRKEQGAGQESIVPTMGKLRAMVTPKFRTIKEVGKAKDKIVDRKTFTEAKEKIEKLYYEVQAEIYSIMPESIKREPGISRTVDDLFEDIVLGQLGKFEYSKPYEPLIKQSTKDKAQELKQQLIEMPTEYFEVKPQRAVGLDEFRGAIIPSEKLQDIGDSEQILRNAGIDKIFKYATEEQRKELFKRFPELMFETSARGVRGADNNVGFRISTRIPTTKTAQENPLTEKLQITGEFTKQNPTALAKASRMITDPKPKNYGFGYNQLSKDEIKGRSDLEIVDMFKKAVTDNLLFIYNLVPEQIRNRSKQWYVGANNVAQRFGNRYDLSVSQSSGILAVLSPQRDWYINVSLAERVMDTMANQQEFMFNENMMKTAKRIYKKAELARTETFKNKKLGDLQLAGDKALFIRAFDETYNERGHKILSPEGDFLGYVLNKDGSRKTAGWGTNGQIANAIRIFENGSLETVSDALGMRHKVRSFYNNIADPMSENGDVTIDTHAVAVGLLKPLSGNTREVGHNFGAVSVKLKGVEGFGKVGEFGSLGSYGIFADAYRDAAEIAGVLPREMQSITWTAIRDIFTETYKANKNNVEKIENVWKNFYDGKISVDQARQEIMNETGYKDPDWARPDSRDIRSEQDSSYEGKLPEYERDLGGGYDSRIRVGATREATTEGVASPFIPHVEESRRGTAQSFGQAVTSNNDSVINNFLSGFKKIYSLSDNFVTEFINSTEPVGKLEERINLSEKGIRKRMTVAEGAQRYMEMVMNRAGRVEMIMKYGAPIMRKDGGISFSDKKGLFQIFEGFDIKEYQQWEQYAKARRAQALGDKEKFISKNEIQRGLALETDKFKKAFKEYQDFNTALLDFMVQAGMLDQRQRNNLAKYDYIPFYRVIEEDTYRGGILFKSDVRGPNTTAVFNNPQKYIMEYSGGTKPIGDLAENMFRNAQALVDTAMKNKAMEKAINLMERAGLGKRVNSSEAAFLKSAQGGGKVVSFNKNVLLKNGKVVNRKIHYDVSEDPHVYASLASMTPRQTDGLFKLMESMGRIFREGITHAPPFMIANLIRGDMAAFVTVDAPLTPVTDTLVGLKNAYADSETIKEMKLISGVGGYNFGDDFRDSARALKRQMRQRHRGYNIVADTQGLTDLLKAGWSQLTRAGEATELATREAIYRKLVDQGMTKEDAAYEALNVINFNRKGAAQTKVGVFVNSLLPLVPFLNARFQGLYRTFEPMTTGKQADRGATIGKGLMLMMANLALYSLMSQDDRWREEPMHRKLAYHIIYPNILGMEDILGTEPILIPRAFEIGAIFTSIPELFLDGISQEGGEYVADGLLHTVVNTFSFNPLPQAIIPAVEVASNYDFFTGRNIDSIAQQRYLKSERVGATTPEAARLLSKASLDTFSPNQISQLIEGYLGTLGGYTLTAFDVIASGIGAIPTRPTGVFGDSVLGQTAEALGFGRFRKPDPDPSNRFVSDFYELKKEVETIYATVNMLKRDGRREQAFDLMDKHKNKLRFRKKLLNINEKLQTLNKKIRMVRLDPKLSGNEKEARLKGLIKQRNDNARLVDQIYKDIRES